MNHDEYVEAQRKRVGEVATGMLDGSIDYLEGSVELSSLLFQAEVPENDPDFIIFVAIASEIDNLPVGKVRRHWSHEALQRHEPAIQEANEWAKGISLTQCRSLVERFHA